MKLFKKVIFVVIILVSIFEMKSFAATGKINIEATRLRKENNTTSEILTNIYEGEKVEILEEKGEWVKIKYSGYTGLIKKEFVDISKNDNKENLTESKTENAKEDSNETINESILNSNEVKIIENCDKKRGEIFNFLPFST